MSVEVSAAAWIKEGKRWYKTEKIQEVVAITVTDSLEEQTFGRSLLEDVPN